MCCELLFENISEENHTLTLGKLGSLEPLTVAVSLVGMQHHCRQWRREKQGLGRRTSLEAMLARCLL